MLRPQGYATWTDPDAPLVERDTATCGHCNCIVHVKPGTASTVYLLPPPVGAPIGAPWTEAPGAGCFICGKPVCLACYADGRCRPWERQLERMEARDRLRRAVGV